MDRKGDDAEDANRTESVTQSVQPWHERSAHRAAWAVSGPHVALKLTAAIHQNETYHIHVTNDHLVHNFAATL